MKYNTETGTLVQVEFENKNQMKKFVKWFNKEGFETFIKSKINNTGKDMITCLAADEKMEWGYYLEMQ